VSPVSGGEARVIKKTADEIVKIDKKAAGSHFPPYKLISGTVTAIESGPPPTLTVKLLGSSTTVSKVRYLSAYSPTVGDSVVGKKYGKDLVILDALAKPPLYLAIGSGEGSGSTELHVIDVTTNTLVGSFSGVGIVNGFVSINSAGTLIGVDSTDTALVVEFPGGGTWDISASGSGYGPVFNADGSKLYSPTGFSGTVYKIDVASRTVDTSLSGFGNPRQCILSPDGDYIYVYGPNGNLYQVELSSFTITNTLTGLADNTNSYLCIDSANRYIYITSDVASEAYQVEISSFSVVNTISFGAGVQPEGVCVSDDSSTVYVVGHVSGDIYEIDASSFTLTSTNAISGGLDSPIVYFAGHLYICAGPGVEVLDATTFAEITSISMSDTTVPVHMALQQPG
jgi:sugar lactone lactonase YvrE